MNCTMVHSIPERIQYILAEVYQRFLHLGMSITQSDENKLEIMQKYQTTYTALLKVDKQRLYDEK